MSDGSARVDTGASVMMASTEPQGRDEVFEDLFDQHAAYVFASLRRLGVLPRDLEDLTQDVFVAVHLALDSYDATLPPKPWLFAFCYRIASNYRRLARHRVEVPGAPSDSQCVAPTPEAALDSAQTRSRLESALDVLSDEHRAVIVMHDIDGMSGPQIAQILGIPLNTAYSRIRLARRSVEASLRDGEDRSGEP